MQPPVAPKKAVVVILEIGSMCSIEEVDDLNFDVFEYGVAGADIQLRVQGSFISLTSTLGFILRVLIGPLGLIMSDMKPRFQGWRL